VSRAQWARLLVSEREWLDAQPLHPAVRFVSSGVATHVGEATSVQTAAVLKAEEKPLLERFAAKNYPLLLHEWTLRAVRAGMRSAAQEEHDGSSSDSSDDVSPQWLQPGTSRFNATLALTPGRAAPMLLSSCGRSRAWAGDRRKSSSLLTSPCPPLLTTPWAGDRRSRPVRRDQSLR
jgi:hypothetical protein